MLSTMHSLEFVDTGKINYKIKGKIINRTVVLDYNINMGGIDGGDQMLSKFHIMRRYHKAYKKIFFYCVDMKLLNSYIIFKNIYEDRAFHVFKQKLVEEIIANNIGKLNEQRKTQKVTTSVSLPPRFSGQHFPMVIPQLRQNKLKSVALFVYKKRKGGKLFISVKIVKCLYASYISNITTLNKISNK